ncbi:rho GTPase-activating protein 20-like [Rhinophrynus dorsalis]
MTPQQKASLQKSPSKDLGSLIQEGGKKMRATVQRRRSTSSAITRALSKTKLSSREITLFPEHSGNGLLLGAFCSPSSMFILKDRVQLTNGWQTQERLLFLFSDSLLIAKSKSSASLKLKKQVRLSEIWISSSLSEVSEKKLNADNSFVFGWPTTNYIVTFSSSDIKEKWLSTLCWHINEVKKDENPSKVPISVFYLDADEFMSSTTVIVSNMDAADKVIKMASQQLGIPGRPGDYHLWVMSGKEEPPYPLIGHEFPYSITMNSRRETLELPRGSNNNIFVDQGSEAFSQEHLPRDRQCQFILKLRPQVPLHLGTESAQKHSRRKKSLIDWALRRSGSNPIISSASQSPTTPRKLFGLSLSSVCHNGNLPKPIMDMLLLLYEEGPNTKGIFRRSANAKTCKELKEKLICGDDVQMDGESVFVAAAVIKDFLRNIPDSILSSDMYGLWMEVTDMEQHEYKVETIKRLVEQLPEANFILLQHLFAVLHHIEKNSEENQMTAFNLALCIAPNMLWLPTASDPEEESRSTKKVALLVQFLIENYEHIFGNDAESLFRRPDPEQTESNDDLAGISLIHGQDSSDELEFVASDLDKSDPNLLKDVDGMFDESLLLEDREDWDLFSEIAACYQSKTRMNNLESYNKDPFNNIDSACCLSPARDRCASEPSVCLSSKLPVQDHEPVARQSSCDATIMHNHIDYINQLKQLQLESQKLLDKGLSLNMNKARQTFWRSPQPGMRMEKSSPQKSNPSNRSSFSSLSSTTTSPSASSLSSLDSAFSYCSESSVFSPNEVTSLPFMFGTSARLHTLSPEISKKKLKEWHIPLSTLLGNNACDIDPYEEQEETIRHSSINSGRMDVEVNSEGPVKIVNQDNVFLSKEVDDLHYSGEAKNRLNLLLEPKCEPNHIEPKAAPENGNCVRRETSVKHIEIRRPESTNDESLKHTKITLFMPPNIMQVKNLDDENSNTNSENLRSQNMKPHIPQTVFYGQNAPLVLHSVSRRQHSDMEKPHWQTQLKHILKKSPANETQVDSTNGATGDWAVDRDNEVVKKEHSLREIHTEETIKEPALNQNHSNTIASFTHSIRIILPSSVRNTVKEYFKHSESRSPGASQVEDVESDVIPSRTEWCNLRSADPTSDAKDQSRVVEESFV